MQFDLFHQDPDACPRCGEDLFSIDFFGDEMDWMPCCDFGRALAELEWGAMDHAARKFLVADRLCRPVQEVVPMSSGWFKVDHPLEVKRIERATARSFIEAHHEHHPYHHADLYCFGAFRAGELVAVAAAGRPVARMLDRQKTMIEVTRVATLGGLAARHAATALYGACAREAKRRKMAKVITYTLEWEPGTSLKAAGFAPVYRGKGGRWNRKGRPRSDRGPTTPKIRWERVL